MKRSVRKIRTVSEIQDLFEIVPDHGSISRERLREELIESRVREASTYLGLLRRRRRSYPSHDDPRLFLALAEDRVSFARTLGIWVTSDDKIRLTDYGLRLKGEIHRNESNKKTLILGILLNSDYVAYRNFMNTLSQHGGSVKIPRIFQSRRQEFKRYIASLGFVADGASFHTIKDLYYDFGFLNWIKVDRDETIFFTRDLHSYESNETVRATTIELKEKLPDRKVGIVDFRKTLIDGFRSLGYEQGAYYDILRLRDKVCQALRLSDDRFAQLCLELYNDKKIEDFNFSVGPLVEHPPMGYSKKLNSLPRLYGEEPITKVMVTRFGA